MMHSVCTPPLHDNIIALLFYLHFDLSFFVVHLKYPHFFCVDELLQFQHILPCHSLEIIPFKTDLYHFFTFPEVLYYSTHVSM